jgi:putative oxidoreductase
VLERVLLLKKIPLSPDFGRLLLRVSVFSMLFYRHGAEKLFTFHSMTQVFLSKDLDPVHIGPIPSLIIAAIADGICSLLIVAGLATRWAALFLFGNLFVVWAILGHFAMKAGNSEALIVYMSACLTIFFLGAGKISIDALIERASQKKQAQENAA